MRDVPLGPAQRSKPQQLTRHDRWTSPSGAAKNQPLDDVDPHTRFQLQSGTPMRAAGYEAGESGMLGVAIREERKVLGRGVC